MCNTIAQHYAEESAKRLDKKLEDQDGRIKIEIRTKFSEFDEQMVIVTEYCKKQMLKV
jgi:hypothetical protein